jgi:hypothetical protein
MVSHNKDRQYRDTLLACKKRRQVGGKNVASNEIRPAYVFCTYAVLRIT